MSRFDWHEDAACAEIGWQVFYPERGDNEAYRQARGICATCPVRTQCLDEALRIEGAAAMEFRAGIRGGLSPRQRARIAKERRAAAPPIAAPHGARSHPDAA